MHPRDISISGFDYELPDERIARYPSEKRDHSKLLVFRDEKITDSQFLHIGDFLSGENLLIGNNTRVIPARLFFQKKTGAIIEIFCLEPHEKSHQDAMNEKGESIWHCMVGGAKKWKSEPLELFAENNSIHVEAHKLQQDREQFTIRFLWNSDHTFSEILEKAGELPLPPYFNRQTEEEDYHRYQTVFARMKGSVAAPTAGLHFTESLLQQLREKGIQKEEITLHVGAGTFRPVSAESMEGHSMHNEKFSVSLGLVKILAGKKKIIAVGTTTTRALESLYWLAIKLQKDPGAHREIHQWEPYEENPSMDIAEALKVLIEWAEKRGLDRIDAETSILIAPGYHFRIISGIITNFHLPKSTLLLLIAAITGNSWKKIYEHALKQEYRFLSYGDSSLLFVQ